MDAKMDVILRDAVLFFKDSRLGEVTSRPKHCNVLDFFESIFRNVFTKRCVFGLLYPHVQE